MDRLDGQPLVVVVSQLLLAVGQGCGDQAGHLTNSLLFTGTAESDPNLQSAVWRLWAGSEVEQLLPRPLLHLLLPSEKV